jgi:xanthine dehydrogenase small subunit
MSKLEKNLRFNINGESVCLTNLSPTMTLLEYLRQSGRIGTKEGCGDGDCGACTVAIIGKAADGKCHYQAVNSCLIPLGSVAGREVITVEGVGKGKLHPVQEAMVKTGGSQCGYCTPGFIMSMFAAYYNGKVDDISVEGNLCRCTGYLPIRRAAQSVTKEISHQIPDDNFTNHLANQLRNQLGISDRSSDEILASRDQSPTTTPDTTPINYSSDNQEFYRPTNLQAVLNLLQHHPQAILLAGGTDLGLEMSHHRQEFPVVISLEAVKELQKITENPEFVEIGAGVTLTHMEENLRGLFPSLDKMLYWFAARQIRNRATLGGNIATASPIGDLAPVLLSLDARLKLVSQGGKRIIRLMNFFKAYRQTDLQSGEVIASIIIPHYKKIAPNAVCCFNQSYKVGKRGTDDIAIVSAAFTIYIDKNNQIIHARLAYGGVAATTVRAVKVEKMLIGKPWEMKTILEAKEILKNTFTPLTDFRGSANYRILLVVNLWEKFFVEMADG